MEWIEHPLLMLVVRGSNHGHSISKNTTSLPQSPRGSPRSRAHPRISELSVRGRSQNQKKGFKLRSRNVSFCHGLEIWNGQIWALPSYPSNSQFIIQDITHVLHRELLSLMKLEKKLQIWTWHCGIYLIFKIWTRAIYYKPAWLRRSIWIKKRQKIKTSYARVSLGVELTMLGIFSCTGSRIKGEDGFEKGAEIAQLSKWITYTGLLILKSRRKLCLACINGFF